jgi:hypothetical protein
VAGDRQTVLFRRQALPIRLADVRTAEMPAEKQAARRIMPPGSRASVDPDWGKYPVKSMVVGWLEPATKLVS